MLLHDISTRIIKLMLWIPFPLFTQAIYGVKFSHFLDEFGLKCQQRVIVPVHSFGFRLAITHFLTSLLAVNLTEQWASKY